MIKPRTIARAIRVEYTGAPTFSFAVDGTTLVNAVQLPNQTVRQTRRILLPPGLVGYVHQPTFSGYPIQRFSVETDPVEAFSTLNLYHYYEVLFEGTVTLQIYSDEVQRKINNRVDEITLTTRNNRRQDTRKVYFPPLLWGYVPHLAQDELSVSTGQVHRATPVALPDRFYRGLRDHSEVQITYQGFVDLEVYLDGEMISLVNLDAEVNEEEYLTTKHYLPAGSRGYALQWIQFDQDGEIAVFESDTTLTDMQQPASLTPEGQL
jgi:hypothetical protein